MKTATGTERKSGRRWMRICRIGNGREMSAVSERKCEKCIKESPKLPLRFPNDSFLSSLIPISVSFGFHSLHPSLYIRVILYLSFKLNFNDISCLPPKKRFNALNIEGKKKMHLLVL
jgi:hypothetical protein